MNADEATGAFLDRMAESEHVYVSALLVLLSGAAASIAPLAVHRTAALLHARGGARIKLGDGTRPLVTARDVELLDVGKFGAMLWKTCRCTKVGPCVCEDTVRTAVDRMMADGGALDAAAVSEKLKMDELRDLAKVLDERSADVAALDAKIDALAPGADVGKAMKGLATERKKVLKRLGTLLGKINETRAAPKSYELFLSHEIWKDLIKDKLAFSDDDVHDHPLFSDVVVQAKVDTHQFKDELDELLKRSWNGRVDGTLWEGHAAQKAYAVDEATKKALVGKLKMPTDVEPTDRLTLAKLGKVIQYTRNVASHFQPDVDAVSGQVEWTEAIEKVRVCVQGVKCLLDILASADWLEPRPFGAAGDDTVAFCEMRAIASRSATRAEQVLDAWDSGASAVANVFASASHEDPFLLWIRDHAGKLTDKKRMPEVMRRVQGKDAPSKPAALRELDGVELGDKIDALGPRASWAASWNGVPVVAHANVDDHGAVKEFETEDLLELGLEASIVAEIGHPGLLRIYGQFKSKYVICEHVVTTLQNADVSTFPMAEQLAKLEKVSIGAAANKKEMAVNLKAGSIAHQAASVLAVLETHEVFHRRLSPNCIFLTAEGNVRVGGLGMARTMPGAGKHTDVGGNGKYEAPEVKNGNAEHSFKSDLFSLGVTLSDTLVDKYFDDSKMKGAVEEACDNDPDVRGSAKDLAAKLCLSCLSFCVLFATMIERASERDAAKR